MERLQKTYPWFKLYSKGWLTGTIRATLTPAERGVWADLLALANESRVRGVICRAKGIPYTREYLANMLEVPLDLLNSTIAKCSTDENADDPRYRIVFDTDDCIIITNWAKYQAIPDRVKAGKIAKARNVSARIATAEQKADEGKATKETRKALLFLSGQAESLQASADKIAEVAKNTVKGQKPLEEKK